MAVTVSFDAQELKLDTSEDAEQICQELEDKNVEILILQGNTIGIEAAERIGQELSKQSSLREAHFKDIFTGRGKEVIPTALEYLLSGISASEAQLTLLDLSDNAIGPIGAPAVVEFLNSSSCLTIEKLFLNNCGWGPEGSSFLATTIPRLRCLREFVCGRSRLENKGAINISKALLELENLEVLIFNQNGIKEEGVIHLVEVLEANADTIREFDLGDNWIKAEGSKAICDVLKRAKNLESFHLSDAYLDNEDFGEICKAISCSPSFANLMSASFEGNELSGGTTVDLIISTFSHCRRDFTLDLLDNDFTPDELKRLETLSQKIKILVDEDDDDDYSNDESVSGNASDLSNGYVNIEPELREISHDFIKETKVKPFNEEKIHQAFALLIRPGLKKSGDNQVDYQAIQILSEELGLIKCEMTGKKKPYAADAIKYITNHLDELPQTYKDFFQNVD